VASRDQPALNVPNNLPAVWFILGSSRNSLSIYSNSSSKFRCRQEAFSVHREALFLRGLVLFGRYFIQADLIAQVLLDHFL
jgi:hypothetical protein